MKTQDLKELLLNTFGMLNGRQLMALTIYGEARGESKEGKIAVGSVILERVDHRKWDGQTIQEVCLMPYQFSCYLPNDPNFKALKLIAESWKEKYQNGLDLQQCYRVAADLLDGIIDRTPAIAMNHATQYKTISCQAAWANKMKLIATIGAHEFYA